LSIFVRQNDKSLNIGTLITIRPSPTVFNRIIKETQPNYSTMQPATATFEVMIYAFAEHLHV
jgi:hypothetical protein